jgi:periplasmic divalent cation tolerance protein
VTDKVVILVTSPNRRECRKIARHLVKARLAACVNITQPIESIYRWQGKVEDEKELLLVIKSTRDLFPEIRRAILTLHTYKVPEVICLPIVDGSQAYLDWLGESVKQPARAQEIVLGEEPAP